ncbi:MAG: polysaccharide deacetylase family protein [Cytophagaceae bacterium]
MLRYRLTQVLFFVLLTGIILADLFSEVPGYFYVLPFVIYLAIIFYASYFINSGFFVKAICSGNEDKKQIALTFDDGPDPLHTPRILDVLKKNNIKATFFLIGKKIKGNEGLVERIYNEGHIVGNHTYSHSFWIDFNPSSRIREELLSTEKEIENVINKKIRYFRPPYGVTNPMIAKALSGMKYAVIGWNIRSMDTVEKDNLNLCEKVISQLKPGSIILFHDTRPELDKVLETVIMESKRQGYEISPLNELTNLQAYA